MQAGRAAIVAYTMPLWAVLLSRLLLGERFGWLRLLALATGTAGMAVLLAPTSSGWGRPRPGWPSCSGRPSAGPPGPC